MPDVAIVHCIARHASPQRIAASHAVPRCAQATLVASWAGRRRPLAGTRADALRAGAVVRRHIARRPLPRRTPGQPERHTPLPRPGGQSTRAALVGCVGRGTQASGRRAARCARGAVARCRSRACIPGFPPRRVFGEERDERDKGRREHHSHPFVCVCAAGPHRSRCMALPREVQILHQNAPGSRLSSVRCSGGTHR
jgi:hypothetical protein